MKSFLALGFLILSRITTAQSPVGVWATIDDETRKVKSHVNVYEQNGQLYGVIIKLIDKPKGDVCTKCSGSKKDKPIIGLVIMERMKKSGEEWTGGTITDPNNGKTYKCAIRMESADKLKLRGYIGISLIGRTQYWVRVK